MIRRIWSTTLAKFLMVLLVCSFVNLSHSETLELKTAAQQSAPKYFLSDDGKMIGICAEIIESVMAIDSELSFVGYDRFVPFKRIKASLDKGSLEVFFGLKVTPERKKLYQFSDVPLYEVHYVLASHYDDTLNILSLDEFPTLSNNVKLLTVAGTGAERLLQKQGDINVIGVRTPDVMLKMLSLKRARMAFYHDLGINYLIQKNEWDREIKVLPTHFSSHTHTVAFSKNVPKSTIQRIERALLQLIDSGQMQQIHQKYGI